MINKKLILLQILLSLFIFMLNYNIYADFDDLGAGARAVGMGNAFTALSDDPFGFYYNPAGPGFLKRKQLGADYGRLWMGLTDNSELSNAFISFSLPISKTESSKVNLEGDNPVKGSSETYKADISTNVKDSQFEQIYEPRIIYIGTFSLGIRYFSLLGYYQESSYYLGFSRQINNRLAWGVNLKMLHEKYTIDRYLELSPVFNYGKKSSVQNFSIDMGLLYNIMPCLFVGVSGSDLNQPNLGLMEDDPLDATGRIGLGWHQNDIIWALDGIYSAGNWYGAGGVERWFNDLFAARSGINFGGKDLVNLSLGFSFNFVAAQTDYVFQLPLSGIRETNGSHRISFVYRFGQIPKDELRPGSLELYYSTLQEETAILKDKLEKTEKEKNNLEKLLIDEASLRIRERIEAAKAIAQKSSVKKHSSSKKEDSREIRHIVRKGETLQSIAKKYYGEEKYWNEIYKVNKETVGRGGVVKPKQVLIIPQISEDIKQDSNKTEKPKKTKTEPKKTIPVEIETQKIQPPSLPEMKSIKIDEIGIKSKTKPKVAVENKKQKIVKPKSTSHKRHIVQKGENLRSIAYKYYKDTGRWKEIYKANKDKVISGQLTPGQEIVIP